MSELAQVGVAGALVAQIPADTIRRAVALFDFFLDRPTSDAVDPALLAQKLAIRLHQLQATDDEVMRVANRLDLKTTYRPTVADVVSELKAIRREAMAAEWEKTYGRGRSLRDPDGNLYAVAAQDVDRLMSEGWTPG